MRTLRLLRIALPCLSIGMLLTSIAFDGWRERLSDKLDSIRWQIAALDAAEAAAQTAIAPHGIVK